MTTLSLLVPILYLLVLTTSLATFSHIYRTRKATKSFSLAPYFPPNTARNVYLSLMSLDAKVPDSVLRAALLARAQEDIGRIIEIRTRKQALSTLLARGCVGEEIMLRLTRAEAEIGEEVKDVVSEANAFHNGWGQTIFQSAAEMANNATLKKKLAGIAASVAEEKEWWDKKRESTREGFMRELDEEEKSKAGEKAPVVVAERRGQSSDEDAVLVEKEPGAGAGAGGKAKKKKGKK